jgi:hypothetical protein
MVVEERSTKAAFSMSSDKIDERKKGRAFGHMLTDGREG